MLDQEFEKPHEKPQELSFELPQELPQEQPQELSFELPQELLFELPHEQPQEQPQDQMYNRSTGSSLPDIITKLATSQEKLHTTETENKLLRERIAFLEGHRQPFNINDEVC